MKVAALTGGVGGAKLLVGLNRVLDPGDLAAIVNTGDDAVIYGVHVSPDVDIVTYWLAGVADTERGWGISGDTFTVVAALQRLGAESWFRLGDRDLATCLYRTARLREGASLSTVADEMRRAYGVEASIVPMSDDPVRTELVTSQGVTLSFQEYFVRERALVDVTDIKFRGCDEAKPAPGVLEAIREAAVVFVCPSNPVLSIDPILSISGVRDALRSHENVIAVTPIVRGAALKGPADALLKSLGGEASASGVARRYADFCDVFVVDASDAEQADEVERYDVRAAVVDTVMRDQFASERLSRDLLTL